MTRKSNSWRSASARALRPSDSPVTRKGPACSIGALYSSTRSALSSSSRTLEESFMVADRLPGDEDLDTGPPAGEVGQAELPSQFGEEAGEGLKPKTPAFPLGGEATTLSDRLAQVFQQGPPTWTIVCDGDFQDLLDGRGFESNVDASPATHDLALGQGLGGVPDYWQEQVPQQDPGA